MIDLNLTVMEKIDNIRKGKNIDLLWDDPDYIVRQVCARHGHKLDKYIKDSDIDVRIAVVEHGYGLDILINDKSFIVRNAVIRYCKEHLDNEECKNLLRLYNI